MTTRQMNIPIHHDNGAAREVRTVDVIQRIRLDIDGKRFTFAIHKSFEDLRPPVLADYRSGYKLTELSMGASFISNRPDYASMARRWIGDMIDKHGAAKIRERLESADRLN